MRLIQIGIANVNTTVGATRSNTDRAIIIAREMAAAGVHLGTFQEQLIGGYPAEDLVQWRRFVCSQKDELIRFASETAMTPTIYTLGCTVEAGGGLYNVVAVVHAGKVVGLVPKEKLPNYNVFYEKRFFSSGRLGLRETVMIAGSAVPFGDFIFDAPFGTFGVEVCEDLWSPDGPLRRRCFSGAEVVVNASASPFRAGIRTTREELLATRAADNETTIVYTNAVGANDSLIFDGGGYVFQNGRKIKAATRWREGWEMASVDLDRTRLRRQENTTWRTDRAEYLAVHAPTPLASLSDGNFSGSSAYPLPATQNFFFQTPEQADVHTEFFDDLWEAATLFVGDYFEKTKAFSVFGVALSGGRDSALTALLVWNYLWNRVGADLPPEARRALLREKLQVFWMPSAYSSSETARAAEAFCAELGIPLTTVPIHDAVINETGVTATMLGRSMLDDHTLQNIQSRIRGMRMWNWANAARGLFLQTSNMSEKATGYTTIGGDMMGAISPIANLPKTVIVALLQRLRVRFGFSALDAILAIPASAELRPHQQDEADLLPFPVLDAMLYLFAGERMDTAEMSEALSNLFPERRATIKEEVERFALLFTSSVFKWVQTPLSAHLGNVDLDRERTLQFPVVTSREWLEGRSATSAGNLFDTRPSPG